MTIIDASFFLSVASFSRARSRFESADIIFILFKALQSKLWTGSAAMGCKTFFNTVSTEVYFPFSAHSSPAAAKW